MSRRWTYLLIAWCMLIRFAADHVYTMTQCTDITTSMIVAEIPETDSESNLDSEEKTLFVKDIDHTITPVTAIFVTLNLVCQPNHYVRPWPEILTPPPGC